LTLTELETKIDGVLKKMATGNHRIAIDKDSKKAHKAHALHKLLKDDELGSKAEQLLVDLVTKPPVGKSYVDYLTTFKGKVVTH